jgi:dienelactone hydrolase
MRDTSKFIRPLRQASMAVVAGLYIASSSDFVLAETSIPDFSHFPYDRTASFNVKQVAVKVRNGVTIQDITYTGTNGDTVPAYLVIPKGSGKFAGIIWGHWLMDGAANANRTEFLDEAIALAPSGVVSLLIDDAHVRPGFKPVPGIGPGLMAQQVVDLRRGLDLLLSRADIDATRVAYVGHSYDSVAGAILDAMDKRIAAFVFMGGPQFGFSFAKPYADKLGPAPALFQYGLHDDEFVPVAAAKEYIAKASGPKTVKFYDAGHALNAEARMDRDNFLSETLKLHP